SIRVREGAGDTGSVDLAEDLEHLARVLREILITDPTVSDEALQSATRALTIERNAGTPIGVARALRIRGLISQGRGDYAHARSDLEEALALQEGTHSTHPETALTLAHLGEQLELEGLLTEAHERLSRACAMAEATLRSGHPDIANCLRSFALVREDLGDFTG